MATNRNLLAAEFSGTEDEDNFDPAEDVMPSDSLVIKKEVTTQDGRISVIEAQITRNDSAPEGITWVKLYEKRDSNNFSHFYVDTMNPELILNALENYLNQGKGPELAEFIRNEGKSIQNTVEFRLRLEAALGRASIGGDAQDDAGDLF